MQFSSSFDKETSEKYEDIAYAAFEIAELGKFMKDV
jgi:hypothetical protein